MENQPQQNSKKYNSFQWMGLVVLAFSLLSMWFGRGILSSLLTLPGLFLGGVVFLFGTFFGRKAEVEGDRKNTRAFWIGLVVFIIVSAIFLYKNYMYLNLPLLLRQIFS